MEITHKISYSPSDIENKISVLVDFFWYETNKRILHKKAKDGEILKLKFLNENPNFKQNEVVFITSTKVYLVAILPCECLEIKPRNNFEIASICYEIGNKHLPLFYEENGLKVPYEKPLLKQLLAMGFDVEVTQSTLTMPLNTTVAPHDQSTTLFSRIMNLTQKE